MDQRRSEAGRKLVLLHPTGVRQRHVHPDLRGHSHHPGHPYHHHAGPRRAVLREEPGHEQAGQGLCSAAHVPQAPVPPSGLQAPLRHHGVVHRLHGPQPHPQDRGRDQQHHSGQLRQQHDEHDPSGPQQDVQPVLLRDLLLLQPLLQCHLLPDLGQELPERNFKIV